MKIRTVDSRPRAGGGVPGFTAGWAACGRVVPAQAGVFRDVERAKRHVHRRPRAGGGVPPCARKAIYARRSSPRRRGCSESYSWGIAAAEVVPAQAGVFRAGRPILRPVLGRPRAGGGVPMAETETDPNAKSSPRRRGCSVDDRRQSPRPGVVPAQAGVFQETLENDNADSGRPRAGGGVP